MSDPRSEKSPPYVWAMGPLPPPVTGMSLLTEKVIERLKETIPVNVADWSTGDERQLSWFRATRFLRTAKCLLKLIAHGPVRNGRLYLAANSRGGLFMTGMLVKTGCLLGYKVYLHHHTYNYIDSYDRKMAWIDRSMGSTNVHVVHCPRMIDAFRSVYHSKCAFEYFYPSIVSLQLGQPRTQLPPVFRLGFLANLTLAKGVDLVLDTFRKLRQKGRNVELCLAGPCSTGDAERLINEAKAEFKGALTHVGGVYGKRKEDFFHSIDCFLFPSRTESWGIVLNEALAAGVPVIAANRGCVHTLVGDRAGVIVEEEQRYVSEAVRQVEAWMDSPQIYLAASQAAIEQAEHLHREASQQLERFVSRFCATSCASSAVAGIEASYVDSQYG